ncbi:probable helicase MAGATAMA 3 isoform X2 [Nymphaea colorata]|uniref:probable helicase MAGATAMA 3 isoform X2 n=1 Tax=Nymphaea colorata TaxID=210225 RepID=UPI00129D925F|nr:probable helicase MAGATAMA 3 isoform X2 [Nymphaea colorata]
MVAVAGGGGGGLGGESEREKAALEKVVQGAFHISRFHKIVLSWDFIQLLSESSDASSKKRKKGDGGGLVLQKVKHTFRDVDEYMRIFEPLLFEEVKAQITQGSDEEAGGWDVGVVVAIEESNGFHILSFVVKPEFGEDVSDNDLVLLSREKFEGAKTLPATYAFAIVDGRDGGTKLKLRTFLGGEVKQLNVEEVESNPRLSRMLSVFQMKNIPINIRKVCSLSTIMREYAALHAVGTLPFSDLILSATAKMQNGDLRDHAWNVPRPLMEFLENNHNKSQLEAIQAGLSRQPVTLIQGPPGTGKTQTILGLLSAILHSTPLRVQAKGVSFALQSRPVLSFTDKYVNWVKASPWLTGTNPRDAIMPEDGDDGFFPLTGNELKPEVVASKRKYRAHVLVCAPSNSALDEIVVRLLNTGIVDENSHQYHPKIVRIGLNPHHSIQAVSMDYLVDQRLASMDFSTGGAGKNMGPSSLQRDHIRASIIDESAIVFSTLSFSGSGLFSRMNRIFDVVVIDEAAQAVEPATLIPLAHGCKQLFLVGDPLQLPATVISSTAERFGYGMSLFKRFQLAGYPVHMLKTQYRMHPEIRSFPSKEFYAESLDDGPNVLLGTMRAWHVYRCFGPFCFFDIDGIESQPSGSGSWVNIEEVEFILLMFHNLVSRYPELNSSSQIAVISPYRHQVKLIRERFRAELGAQAGQLIDVNTVDGFQGREKDVAIFSCVRSNTEKRIGFVADFRRMNVGITRARSSILVVGSASTLAHDKHWHGLVENAKERKCYFKVSKPYSSFFSEANLKSMRTSAERVGYSDEDSKEILKRPVVDLAAGYKEETEMDAAVYEADADDGTIDEDYGGFDD